jgi:hypothetical protein
VLLQNCVGVPDGEVGSCSERCETSYVDGSTVTCVKLEQFKEENLDPLSSPLIKTDPDVSFMSVFCISAFHRCPEWDVCVFVCPHESVISLC